MDEYICNKANQPMCFKCNHSYPHNKKKECGMICTEYGECIDQNMEVVYKVRCISVNSKTGQQILKDIQKGGNEEDD